MSLIDVARKYIGQKEKPGNAGFQDPEFEKKMVGIAGHRKGEAWCAYFVELCLKEAFPARLKEIDKVVSPSAVTTFKQMEKAGYKITRLPEPGAIVVWQRFKDGKESWQGHIGIVTEVINGNRFKSVEGNTNSAGGREGDSVQEKTRTLSVLTNGLNVMGFITFK